MAANISPIWIKISECVNSVLPFYKQLWHLEQDSLWNKTLNGDVTISVIAAELDPQSTKG